MTTIKQSLLKNKLFFSLILLFLLLAGVIYNFSLSGKCRVITGDGQGYYAYLPALFIYQDFDYHFVAPNIKEHYGRKEVSHFGNQRGNNWVNKYSSGFAILQMPFFMLAHGFALVSNYTADGYSTPYHVFTLLGSIIYSWLGGIFLFYLLRTYPVKSFFIYVTVFAFLFGTHFFYFAIDDVSYTHAYNFTLVTLFALLIRKFSFDHDKWKLLFSALLLGLIIQTRMINILVVLSVPFLLGSFKNLKYTFNTVFRSPLILTGCLLLPIIGFVPQFLFWKADFGSFLVYSYGKEGFNFADPEIIKVLFSYNRGFFLYTPMAFIALTGFFTLLKERVYYSFFTLFLFLAIVIYVTASWWDWHYGCSFGMRPLVDYLSFFAILLGLSFSLLRSKYFIYPLIGLCISALALNQIQSYQYKQYILHWCNMDKEKYWKVFLKTSSKYRGMVWD